jgi:hypothetical protein
MSYRCAIYVSARSLKSWTIFAYYLTKCWTHISPLLWPTIESVAQSSYPFLGMHRCTATILELINAFNPLHYRKKMFFSLINKSFSINNNSFFYYFTEKVDSKVAAFCQWHHPRRFILHLADLLWSESYICIASFLKDLFYNIITLDHHLNSSSWAKSPL